MGIGVVAWRQRIGDVFLVWDTYSGILHLTGHEDKARVTCRLACIVVVLLLIAGVESNPGPVKLEDIVHRLDDLTHCMDNLMQELRDT